MKKKILCLLLTVLLSSSVAGGLCACSPSAPPPAGGAVDKISASLLDGKIANFLGAEGLGVKDKSQEPAALSLDVVSPFGVVAYDSQDNANVQKKTELVKDTEDGHKDVHFYAESDSVKSYQDLNKQFAVHHHKGEECKVADCDLISDEIEQQEQLDQENTIISLDARVNKLYNYGDFTFFSISSAVEGQINVRNQSQQGMPFYMIVGDEMVVVNAGNGAQIAEIGVSLIVLEDGAIPIKQFENDTVYHVANYWSDDYNQSYITDNKTGKTYSLAQFPRIFSVENGVIKVYNENANGKFDYYEPKIVDGEMEFEKIALPSAETFRVALNTYVNVLKKDIYGNKLIESRQPFDDSNDTSYDQNGEKILGEKFIGATQLQSVINILEQEDRQRSNRFAPRYRNASRYHMGSDGRIYRLNFYGNLSDISVNVLNQNCVWQDVESTAEVTFEDANGFILWSYSKDQIIRDYFRITKISGGYAYYSSAATTDGGWVWQSHTIYGSNDIQEGEYVGVVKIPTSGPIASQKGVPYEHLEYYERLEYENMNFSGAYKVFLIGDTQMMIVYGSDRLTGDKLIFVDVATGESRELELTPEEKQMLGQDAPVRMMYIDVVSVQIRHYGWLSLIEEIDFDNFNSNDIFTDKPIDYKGGLDAYFKLVTDKLQ